MNIKGMYYRDTGETFTINILAFQFQTKFNKYQFPKKTLLQRIFDYSVNNVHSKLKTKITKPVFT